MSVFRTKHKLSSKPSFQSYLDGDFDVARDLRRITADQVCEILVIVNARKIRINKVILQFTVTNS